VRQKEMVGSILLSMHNIHYLLDLMHRAREAIVEGRYGSFASEWMQLPAARDW
jgi:queuine tRNA-ribosyltransferase